MKNMKKRKNTKKAKPKQAKIDKMPRKVSKMRQDQRERTNFTASWQMQR